MKTPKLWRDNIKNHIVTEEMIDAALYSVNKRAKNCRNQKRAYKKKRDYYHNYDRYSEKESEYYAKKEALLRHCKPLCIHREYFVYKSIRTYDYVMYFEEEAAAEEEEIVNYYLFYAIGKHTYHTPIYEEQIKQFSNLPVIDIDQLKTQGHGIEDLCSVQFVNSVLAVLDGSDIMFESFSEAS